MTNILPDRRAVLRFGVGLSALCALPAVAADAPLAIHVAKDPDCGCCTSWMRILHDEGFKVSYEHMSYDRLEGLKSAVGLPGNMRSCHTAMIGDYVIEGHVPVADIRRLLDTRPEAIGLAVPGMPYGAPGMGPEAERDAYQVFLIRPDGTAELYTDYPAAG